MQQFQIFWPFVHGQIILNLHLFFRMDKLIFLAQQFQIEHVISSMADQPLTLPMGANRTTRRLIPARSVASTTSSMSL